MRKQSKKIISLLLVVIMLMAAVDPTVSYAAAKKPVTKVSTQNVRNGRKYGSKLVLPFGGNFYYRTTVDLAKSSKKTKLRLKYSHKVTASKSGAFKLIVDKKTVKLFTLNSYPYSKEGYPYDLDTEIYLDSVEIKTGKKWKKIKLTNDGVVARGVYSEMKTYTLKKIPKGTKMRFNFNARVGVPRTSSGK